MVKKVVNLDKLSTEEASLVPTYAGRAMERPVPKYEIPESEMEPRTAYSLIHDELMLDGNSRLNLATFVTTWMEPECEKLMAECFDKNMIDKDEYPQTAMIEERCIKMVSRLFHAEEGGGGVSMIGSSESCVNGRPFPADAHLLDHRPDLSLLPLCGDFAPTWQLSPGSRDAGSAVVLANVASIGVQVGPNADWEAYPPFSVAPGRDPGTPAEGGPAPGVPRADRLACVERARRSRPAG